MACLLSCDLAIRGAEKTALVTLITFDDYILALINILKICFIFRLPSFYMIKGMVANAMSLLYNLLEHMRMLGNIVSDTNKSGLCIMLMQLLQYILRHYGYGTIIKS